MITLPERIQQARGTAHQHLIFPTGKSPAGQPVSLNWNQFNYALQIAGHAAVADKLQSKLLSPWTPLKGATGRRADAFGYSALLVFDLDKIETLDPEEVKSWCGEYSVLVHTTFSHGVDDRGCFRIYMPLDKAVTARQYPVIHAAVLATLPELAARVDPTCAEPTRCYFMPSCPVERQHLAQTLASFGGVEVDTEAALAACQSDQPRAESLSTNYKTNGTVPIGLVMPPPVAEGGRNTALVSALGSAYAKGFTPEAVMPVALDWGERCSPAMDPAEVQTTVRSMWETHTRNHPPVQTTTSRSSRLLTARELMALPALEWRIKGLLPAKGLATIYGQSGSGKTFIGLDMACAIAAGSPRWFGSKVKGAPVAYGALEGAGGLRQRVTAWEAHHKIPAPAAVRFILGGFTLLEDHHAADVASDVLKNLGTGAVVIIDTLNQSAPGADENSSVDMGRVIANAKRLADAIDGLVILIHHSGKDQGKGMRGHSSLHAAMDAIIEVVQTPNGRAWRVTKSKDGESGAAHGFELVSYVVGQDADGDEIRSCAVRPAIGSTGQTRKQPTGKNQKTALQMLTTLRGDHPHGFPVAEAVRLVAATFNGPDGRKNSRAKEAITSLIDSGHLEDEGGHLSIP